MAEEEYERFEITDYDLDNEFNPNRRRHRATKNQQIYGIWADDSENEYDGDEGTSSGRRGRKGRTGTVGNKPKDYSAPIGFIAGGIQQSGKKVEPPAGKRSRKKGGDGDGQHDDDEDDDDEDDGDDGSADDARPQFGTKPTAGNSPSSESDGDAPAPVHDMRSMAGFRSATGMRPSGAGKSVGNWEQHTRGIGAKLLLQMGYQPGKGLGKDLQGISAPIEAHLRKGRGAIGAYGPEKKTVVPELKKKTTEDDGKGAPEKDDDGQQWRKGRVSAKQKGRYFYKSVEDVIEKGKKSTYAPFERNSKLSQVTVIDMTGPEKRVLSGYHALGQARIEDEELYEVKPSKNTVNFALPELMHNLNLIVEYCEQDIIAIDKRKCETADRAEQLEQEKESLTRITKLEKDYIETLEGALELVQMLVEPDVETFSLEQCEKIFVRLQVDFPGEYKEFALADLAPGVVAPLITARLRDWNPFVEPTRHLDLVKRWKSILGCSDTEKRILLDPYCALVWTGVIPSIRTAANMWDPRIHQPMIALLDAWSGLLPSWILDNVLEQIILSKISAAVVEWDPLTDTIPIHIWIHPWTGLLGSKMDESVYPMIRDKLSKALKAWHPEDRSARAMITPWKDVFAEEDLQLFLTKNIIPKLELRLAELVINPLQQDLEIFNQVWEWNELISTLAMVNILDKFFFPKWLQTLVVWLNQSPNFDQVTRWYQGWKSQFNEDVIRQTTVKEYFRKALELMQRSIGVIAPASTSPPSGSQNIDPIPPPPKPPSLLELHIDPPPVLEFKELVAQKCAERGIIFAPMPGRREMGKQIYRTGKLFCYLDRSVCVASFDGGVSWAPISLPLMLDQAADGK